MEENYYATYNTNATNEYELYGNGVKNIYLNLKQVGIR